MRHRNHYEHENHDGTEMPTCDLKWSKDCDGIGVYHLNPEWGCAACSSLCWSCHEREYLAEHHGERLCGECLSAAYKQEYDWWERYHMSSALAQMEDRR